MADHLYHLQERLLEKWEALKVNKTYRSTFLSYLDLSSTNNAKKSISAEIARL